MIAPTSAPLHISMKYCPHGIVEPTDAEFKCFSQNVNSDIRYYYKLIRNGYTIKETNPIGTSGITIGELAIFVLRSNHIKRRRRY